MNWVGRKIHLYNVTMGLYMLDWWERYLFNFFNSHVEPKFLVTETFTVGGNIAL